jgi:hypothetical protein
MLEVELIYDADCPNPANARAQLLRAFARCGRVAHWKEWRADDPDAPPHVRGYGSPTVLVAGRDVAGAEPVEGMRGCRIYPQTRDEPRGAPPVDLIVAALRRGETSIQPVAGEPGRSGWRAGIAMLPAIGLALLPKVACPACWPAYAGLLGSLGLGFLLDATTLLLLTAVFLAIAVSALAFRARRRRGFGPFAVGLLAAGVVLVGNFAFESRVAMYGGIASLVAASIWNSWPVKRKAEPCPTCIPLDAGQPLERRE